MRRLWRIWLPGSEVLEADPQHQTPDAAVFAQPGPGTYLDGRVSIEMRLVEYLKAMGGMGAWRRTELPVV